MENEDNFCFLPSFLTLGQWEGGVLEILNQIICFGNIFRLQCHLSYKPVARVTETTYWNHVMTCWWMAVFERIMSRRHVVFTAVTMSVAKTGSSHNLQAWLMASSECAGFLISPPFLCQSHLNNQNEAYFETFYLLFSVVLCISSSIILGEKLLIAPPKKN